MPRRTYRIVCSTTFVYAGFFGLYSSLSIVAFRTSGDFAMAEQGMWQLAFLKDQFNTVFGAHNFVNHVYGFNLLIAPVFRLLPSPHLLKWLQVAGVACGAPIVFRVAFRRTGNEALSASLSAAYLLCPIIMYLCVGDYYCIFPVATLLLLVIDQIGRGLWRVALPAMLALACQETVAPTMFMLGLYVAWREDRRAGMCLMAFAALWFGFIALFLIPTLNEGHSTPYLAVYAIYGGTPGEILRTIVTRPGFVLRQMLIEHQGFAYLYKANGIVGFASLLAPEVLLVDMLDFAANLMTTYGGPRTFGRHYGLVSVPILFLAAAEGLGRAQRLVQRWSSRWHGAPDSAAANRGLTLLVLSFAIPTCVAFGPLFALDPFALARVAWSAESAAKRQACRVIPPNAGVVASSDLLLHLAHRPVAYLFPNPFQRGGWVGRPSDPDYGKYIVSGETECHRDRGEDVDFILVGATTSTTQGLLADLVLTRRYRIMERNQYVIVLQRIAKRCDG